MHIIHVCGPSTRDDGGPLYIFNNLKKVPGITIERSTVLTDPKEWRKWDYCLYVDWAQDAFKNLPDFHPPHPSMCWQSDTHWTNEAFKYRLEQSREYDVVYVAQLTGVARFKEAGVNCEWLPHAAAHKIYTPPVTRQLEEPPESDKWKEVLCERIPKYDFAFVGFYNTQRRMELLDRMIKEFPDSFIESNLFFEEAADVYHKARIVLNISVNGDLNMRTFEALSSRSFLLTDRQEGMAELGLKDGVHCAIYDGLNDAIEKAHYYMTRDGERRAIAEEGWKWCWKSNTYWHRALTIARKMGHNIPQ